MALRFPHFPTFLVLDYLPSDASHRFSGAKGTPKLGFAAEVLVPFILREGMGNPDENLGNRDVFEQCRTV